MSVSEKRVEFKGKDGLRIAGDAFGNPSDRPVLLSHGGGQTRHSWAGTARTLASQGWYAVAIDLRGHGESGWAPDGDYYFESFAADVGEVARELGKPVLVGASLGGISSLLVAGRSNSAAALVLVDIATRMEAAGAQRIIDFMHSRPDGFASLEEAADAVSAYNPHRKRPNDLSGLRKNLREREDGRFDWHWDPRFMERDPRASEEGPPDTNLLDDVSRDLSLPTLLVRGRMSDLLSQEGADHFLELVPHAKFADVSGAGHMVAGDRNDVFSLAVVDFLKESIPS